jgi:hypothetical protein
MGWEIQYNVFHLNMTILGTFAKLQNVTISFVICLQGAWLLDVLSKNLSIFLNTFTAGYLNPQQL